MKENVPEFRFEGFTDTWEQRKLGKLCEITTGKLDANAMVEDGEFDFYTSGIKKYKIDIAAFEGPAITIAGNGATVGYMHYADGKFNAYQRTYVLNQFVADRRFLFSEIGKKLPIKIQQEARTGNIPYIVMDMLTGLDISIPLASEQQSIGSFFSTLDHLITLQQRELDYLKETKKTMLSELFPKKSETIPGVRFEGFTNDWEQRKLGEVSELYQPGTISTKELTEEGYPVFGANGYIGFYKAFNHQNSQVTVSARGEGAGTPSFVKGPVWITGNSMVVNIEKYRDFLEENYLYSYLQSQNLKVYVTGGAQPQITRNVLKKMDIHLVGIHEQQSIGSFFSTLDHLITLQQRKLDLLKSQKQTLLKSMFPR